MQVLSDHIHLHVEGGDPPPTVTLHDRIDGRRSMSIIIGSGASHVAISGEQAHVLEWLSGLVAAVAKEAVDDAVEVAERALRGDAEEHAYRRAEDAMERRS